MSKSQNPCEEHYPRLAKNLCEHLYHKKLVKIEDNSEKLLAFITELEDFNFAVVRNNIIAIATEIFATIQLTPK